MLTATGTDVIISLDDVHARGLLNGAKCVELRRRAPRLEPGTRVWLYSKLPVGEVLGFGTLDDVIIASPASLWAKYDRCAGLSAEAFSEYFNGARVGAALKFSAITPLEETVSLGHLRELHPGFQPPQFYVRLTTEALRQRLQSSRRGTEFRPCAHVR